ncbi:Transcriptional regulatory protein sin3 [Friedmanniomyces endolithicus]|nr:Transcriptional regulatory protein sin3 [Friedmanniomyces endolithicus]
MTDKISSLTARLRADGFGPVQITALQDAFAYMDRVQRRFVNNPELLERFNDIVRGFGAAAGAIEVETVVRQVSELFVEHLELVEGFRRWVEVERLSMRSEGAGGVEGGSRVAEGAGAGSGGGAERDGVVEHDIALQPQRRRVRVSRRRLGRAQASGELVPRRPPQNAFQAHLLRDPLLPLPAGVPSPWLHRLQTRHSGGERAVWVDYRSGVPRVSGLGNGEGEVGVERRPVRAERDEDAAPLVSIGAASTRESIGRGEDDGEERIERRLGIGYENGH